MLIAIAVLFLLSFLAPFVHKKGAMLTPVLFSGITAVVFGYFLSFYPEVAAGGVIVQDYTWGAPLLSSLSFRLDGLSLFFALLITFFGVLILLYAGAYMKAKTFSNRFYAYIIFFMAAMVGLVLSSNLIGLFIFWELTSISSYLLIGYFHDDPTSRQSARQALVVTASGGLVLLAGLILLGLAGGSYDISVLLSEKDLIAKSPYLPAIIVLLLIGAFTKSAQFPFHFWLPGAMKAPTPVSAFLHSATMVKAGVFLVFRFHPIFSGNELWQWLLVSIGGFTMIMGAVIAFRADDIKRILAYTTISALGIFFTMAGIDTDLAIQSAIVYVLAHALYKGALFMVAGTLDHSCGTRKLSELSQLRMKMPLTKYAAIMAALSMGGIIPFLGFTGKELLYGALTASSAPLHLVVFSLLFVSSAFFIATMIRVIWYAFFKEPSNANGEVISYEPAFQSYPPLLLGIISIVVAVFSGQTITPLLAQSAVTILPTATGIDLSLWHGFTPVLGLSVATIVMGIVLFRLRHWWWKLSDLIPLPIETIPSAVYQWLGTHTLKLAKIITKRTQNGYLRNYISVFLLTACLLIAYNFYHAKLFQTISINLNLEAVKVYEIYVLLLVSGIIWFLFTTKSRLSTIAAIGIIGYGMALAYTFFSAPDVAITQFLAETLGLILLAVMLPSLPRLHVAHLSLKTKYLVISITFGLFMAATTLLTLSYDGHSLLKDYFEENSYDKGHGKNIVNVILVDFRALDTLGEISVLVITMIGIIALLATHFPKKNTK